MTRSPGGAAGGSCWRRPRAPRARPSWGCLTINREKVLVALSGGVDSAVAAAILVEAGCEVTGITFQLWAEESPGGAPCSLSPFGAERAARIAEILAVPHEVIDLRREFAASVIDYFTAEYSRGRTPNPCVICNRKIKFGALLREAVRRSIPMIATGHYVRVEYCPGKKRYLLKKGLDRARDQSYMLYNLTQEQLARCLFPLGCLTKKEVYDRAAVLGPVAVEQKESQEICFIPGGDYRSFLKQHGPAAVPGPIVDRSGRVLGRHSGIPFYTVGQRRGLGVNAPQPLYVLEIRPADNSIVVGERSELYRSTAVLEAINLIAWPALEREERVMVKVRYGAPAVPARLLPLPQERTARLVFDRPQLAVAPGQAAVFYRGEILLGGGLITRGA